MGGTPLARKDDFDVLDDLGDIDEAPVQKLARVGPSAAAAGAVSNACRSRPPLPAYSFSHRDVSDTDEVPLIPPQSDRKPRSSICVTHARSQAEAQEKSLGL